MIFENKRLISDIHYFVRVEIQRRGLMSFSIFIFLTPLLGQMCHYANEETGVCIPQQATPSALKEPFTTHLHLTWQKSTGFLKYMKIAVWRKKASIQSDGECTVLSHVPCGRRWKVPFYMNLSLAPLNIQCILNFISCWKAEEGTEVHFLQSVYAPFVQQSLITYSQAVLVVTGYM